MTTFRRRHLRAWTALAVAGAGLGMLACGDSAAPTIPTIATIAVTSPIGQRLAVGRTVQLVAAARDAAGQPVGATFNWTSSASAASVNSTGLVTGAAAGPATITASAAGVQGTVTLQVLVTNLNGIGATLDEAFLVALVAGLTSQTRTQVQAAIAVCRDGVTAGNFDRIEQCLANTRTAVSNATNATDRALLATAALYVDHIERLLTG